MTKKISLLFICFALFLSAGFAQNHCNWEEVKNDAKKVLKPYKYYAFKITDITYGPTKKVKEVEVPLFMDTDYRFVFNTSGLPDGVEVEIYDKPQSNASRKLIYSVGADNKEFTYDPPKGTVKNRMYINYIIPASTTSAKGCVLFYSGTK
jgi:outer membrane lipoprotein-sorting protein